MNILLPARTNLAPVMVMEALRKHLGPVLLRKFRVIEGAGTDGKPEAFTAQDEDGTFHLVRWAVPGMLEAGLFDLLLEAVRLGGAGAVPGNALTTPKKSEVRLVLVAEVIDPSWIEIASTLAIFVDFIKVHSVRLEKGEEPGLYFEVFQTGRNIEAAAASRRSALRGAGLPPSPSTGSSPTVSPGVTAAASAGLSASTIRTTMQPPGFASARFDGLSAEEMGAFRALGAILSRRASPSPVMTSNGH